MTEEAKILAMQISYGAMVPEEYDEIEIPAAPQILRDPGVFEAGLASL